MSRLPPPTGATRGARPAAVSARASALPPRRPAARRPVLRAGLLALAALAAAVCVSGCSTGHPGAIAPGSLAEAQTFPYFRVYWVGRRFQGRPLAAVDGLRGYITTVGDSVYYGDCVQSKGVFGSGSCQLPLQVTTIIYQLHSNNRLGTQRNTVVRGVPATVYDEGRSIEIYSGRVAIDIFSDTHAHAIAATQRLLPVNAPGSRLGSLPLPVYCPVLSGETNATLEHVMNNLPGQACQRARATIAYRNAVGGY